jgi:hypothetical protein
MICTKCKTEGILNVANNQEFYFCQVCRTEIELEAVEDFVAINEIPEYSGQAYFYGSGSGTWAPNPAGITCPMDLDNYDDGGDYFD